MTPQLLIRGARALLLEQILTFLLSNVKQGAEQGSNLFLFGSIMMQGGTKQRSMVALLRGTEC